MDPEKQKQITMYFIEEAKEHLQTIEAGLLDLESMLEDPETINEVFRAAHSIKGGAAMLGFTSIQHLAHILEDHFKVLRESSKISVDQELQTLFLKGFDKLQELLDLLQGPFGLTKDAGEAVVKESDPIFAQLKAHFERLLNGQTTTVPDTSIRVPETPKLDLKAMEAAFQSDIPVKLRDMLQLFKQPDSPNTRQNLQTICTQLINTGNQFKLSKWCEMIDAVRSVVSNPNNQFRVLAPIVIKEVKQAQELVLRQRPQEIAISAQLRELIPAPEVPLRSEPSVDDLSDFFAAAPSVVTAPPVEDKATKQWQNLGDRLGWRKQGAWISTAALQFSNAAPEGHLPAPIWLSAWEKPKSSQGEDLKTQYAALIAKLSDCNI
ncbi:Hpt domain-containing protein [Tumidithrix elongata RA019]|uniref:Hpt domain-containing protein n=1 Tax=Tumidithrix elongata BACA0141 TaxID=2716417 RepID=A0AAW9PW08_9CYAN|nr:Hpt domain-containing protein [Tumidithrix elongata RA019]